MPAAPKKPSAPGRVNDPETQSYEMVVADSIEPHPKNPRLHDDDALDTSVDVNGFYGACYVQRSTRLILVGEGRWKAAARAGHTRVPVIFLDVDDDRALRIMAADNPASDRSPGYDDDRLDVLLAELAGTDDGLTGTLWSLGENADPDPPEVEEVPLRRLTRGHFLLSYPIDRHGAVADAIAVLEGDPEIEIRMTANDRG